MRILTFRGDFSYQPKEVFLGFICFCHFEKKDTLKKIKIIAKKINLFSLGDKIILVPFSHLYEDILNKEDAFKLFVELEKSLKEISRKEIIVIPFGVAKELHLNVKKDDTAVKFYNF
jgi:hypothetical protein